LTTERVADRIAYPQPKALYHLNVDTTTSSLIFGGMAQPCDVLDTANVSATQKLLWGVTETIAGLQTEICIFAIAFCAHAVLFGGHRVRSSPHKSKRVGSGEKISCNADNKGSISCGPATPPPSAQSLPVPVRQRTPPRQSQLGRAMEPCMRSCDRETLVNELNLQLDAYAPDNVTAAIAGMLEFSGSKAISAEFFAAVRCVLRQRGIQVDTRIGEPLLRGFMQMRMQCEFDEVLAEVEAGAERLEPGIGLLALKAALRASDFSTALSRFRSLHDLWRGSTASPAPQILLQQLGRLAVQNNAIPALLTELRDIQCSNETLTFMLKECASERRLNGAVQIFEACPEKTACLYNALLDACIECGDLEVAERVMADATHAKVADVVTYNTVIKAYLQNGNLRRAHKVLTEMRGAGVEPNCVTFNELLDATIKVNPDKTWVIIDEMKAARLKPNHITCSILLKSIQPSSKSINIERSMSVVSEMDEDMDEVLLSSVVEACIRVGRGDLLIPHLKKQRTVRRVRVRGAHTYGSIIRAYGYVQDVAGVWETWREMRTCHILPTSITLGCMVEALVANGDVEAGYELILDVLADEQCRHLVNAVIYCSVLKGFSHQKRFERVWAVYKEMLDQRLEFSIVTFNTLVDACARSCEMARIPQLLEDMVAQGIEPNLITYSAILKGYCQENRLDKAFELFQSMRQTTRFQPDEIMFNSLLDGCARQGLYDRGIALLDEMEDLGVRPSNFTLSVLVKLASRGKQLERAFGLCEELSKKYAFRLNVHVYSNLIHACIAHKDLERAFTVLERMLREKVRPDTRVYGLLLRAYAAGGQVQEAAALLRTAAGLPGPQHKRLSAFSPVSLKPQGSLPAALLTEVLESVADRDQGLALELLQGLVSANFKIDSRLKLRLATRAIHGH